MRPWLVLFSKVSLQVERVKEIDINPVIISGSRPLAVDAVAYFSEDPSTDVIAMHVESLQCDARDFFSILKEVSREKPTIILKSGRTAAGSKAAASHTGSIARENDVIFDSMIKQTAVIRAENIEEFFDLAKAFDTLQLPEGNRLAIITLSGGEGVMATDACEMNGMKLATISDRTQQKVKGILPPWEIPLNPFDAGVCMQFHFSDPIICRSFNLTKGQ